jgi:hypothetical protein
MSPSPVSTHGGGARLQQPEGPELEIAGSALSWGYAGQESVVRDGARVSLAGARQRARGDR